MIRKSCVLWTNITLCSSVTPKFTNIGQSWYERNYVKISTISLKNFCNSRPFSLISSSTGQKIIITEEERTKLQRWIELCRFEDERVPKNISEEQFLELFHAESEPKRKRFLNYLFKREMTRENFKKKKEIKSLEVQQRREKRLSFQTNHIDYGLWKNALFTKSNKRHAMDLYHHRLITTMQFGQPLVIDLGFDDHMEGREITSFAEQLALAISMNRKSHEPFNLALCNVNFDSKPFKKFTHIMPNILDSSSLLKMYKESYLDIFPKEKLVYLTPNAREEIEQFDHEAIYIIGGIVDLGHQRPLTLAKAKKEKIKMQKLPLDKYIVFKGQKSLAINVMLAILGDVQEHGDWRKAFEYIPKRLINTECSDTGDRSTVWNKKRSLF